MKPILLRDVWPMENPADFKVHFGRHNSQSEPLDVWLNDRRAWQGWQEYRPKRNEFNRPYIFSLMRFYHEADIWLFGGVFEVVDRSDPDLYKVKLTAQGEEFIGRLKLRSAFRGRGARLNFEKHFGEFEVQEILREPYSGRSFPGYEDVDLSFSELEALARNDRPDWKAALENVKGVYLITDAEAGKRYVGAAYGDQGVWSRWRAYIESGHGGNAGLRAWLDAQGGMDYCRAHFRFTLLERRAFPTPDELVLEREAFWKDILLTRGEQGLNRN